MAYLWLKAFHLIFMVTWMAGLFYLPRLFVYHADVKDEISNARFKIMEWRLFYAITTPGMIITVALGLALAHLRGMSLLLTPSFLAKVGLVALLLVFHVFCGYFVRQFGRDANLKPAVFFRVFNEMPTVLFIPIVIMAVVRPFG